MSSTNIALGIRIGFDQPLFLILLIPAIAIFLIPFLLLSPERRKNIRKILPLIFRIIAATLLVFILAGVKFINTTGQNAVVLLIDTSYSTMSVRSEIEKNAKEILNAIDKNSPVGVVAFGGDQVYSVKLEESGRNLKLTPATDTATDISAALDYAASLCPEGSSLRIILMTDGKQTQGNADSKAYFLANKGIRIDAMFYDTTDSNSPEVQISDIRCPEGIYKNKSAVITAEIKSNIDTNATLTLLDNGLKVQNLATQVKKGSTVIELEVTPSSTGAHVFTLSIEPEKDTVPYNNEIDCRMRVDGESTTLIVTDDIESVGRLYELLSTESNVDVVKTFNAQTSLTELCKYDQIILSNINYYAITGKFVRSLKSYVSTYGRSLIVAGGPDTFMYGGMEGTDLESLLPVSFDFDETDSEDSVAIMLVLDCSSSMGGSKNYISIAKQGAIKCLDALNSNDYAGVVSFSTNAYLESPLLNTTLTNKDNLTRVISSLKISSGTYYAEAIRLACEELRKSDADIKHIIFLSDGQPGDNNYEQDIIDANKQDGITLSTIGLTYSAALLEYMAMYGKGRYYYVEGPDQLPDIMLNEAEQARVDPLFEGEFTPVVRDENEFTDLFDFSTLPPLKGYLGTTLKQNAEAHLVSDNGHPIYASWKYGEGSISCFTSDLMGEWTADWFNSIEGKNVIHSLVRSTLPEIHRDSSILMDVTLDGNTASLTVMTPGEDTRNKVNLIINGRTESPIELTMVYSGLYQADILLSGEGIYDVTIVEKNYLGLEIDSLETAIVVPYSKEYDLFRESQKTFVAGLCSHSQGKIFTDTHDIAKVKMPDIELIYQPVIPMVIIALILFIADTAIRKLRLKDILKYFGKGRK